MTTISNDYVAVLLAVPHIRQSISLNVRGKMPGGFERKRLIIIGWLVYAGADFGLYNLIIGALPASLGLAAGCGIVLAR